MRELITYILQEVKAQRLSKEMAVHLMGQVQPAGATSGKDRLLHPLLHRNTSDLTRQQFSSTFTGQEFFLAHHTVRGHRMLPGVAHLEMARAAVALAAGAEASQSAVWLKAVQWMRPLVVEEAGLTVHVDLRPGQHDEIDFEVYSQEGETTTTYSRGSAALRPRTGAEVLDLAAIQAACGEALLTEEACYDAFGRLGVEYGPAFRGLKGVYAGRYQALARVALPAAVASTMQAFPLHPSLLDAAIQAAVGLGAADGQTAPARVPFALEELEMYGDCTPAMWAFIRGQEEGQGSEAVEKLAIDLCDEQGKVMVRFKGFVFRVLAGDAGAASGPPDLATLLLAPLVKEQAVTPQPAPEYVRHVVVLCEPAEGWDEQIARELPGVTVTTLAAGPGGIETRFERYATGLFEQVRDLLQAGPKRNILLQVAVADPAATALLAGLEALLRTARLENPNLTGQLIEVREPGAGIAEKLRENGRSPDDSRIIYQEGKRWVVGWEQLQAPAGTIPWKDGGVYLVTGGAGALGLIFAREIARQTQNATLVLTGRSGLDAQKQSLLRELEALGATVAYKTLDVTNRRDVEQGVADIVREHGGLNGIMHSAGLIRDQYIIHKKKEDWPLVLGPKVAGVVNLDLASRDLPLDFFILFSSGAGVTGNAGQADYATANAFMDAYAHYRNGLVVSQQRQGRTLSVNWPLWVEGGMRMDEATAAVLRQTTGMVGMGTDQGMQALYQSFASPCGQVLVMHGERAQLEAMLAGQQRHLPAEACPEAGARETAPAREPGALLEKAVEFFKNQVAAFIKLPPLRLEPETPLEKYGVESILMVQLTAHLEKLFGPLPKTLFFEHQTIRAVAGYFAAQHSDRLTALLLPAATTAAPAVPVPTPARSTPRPVAPPPRRASDQGQPAATKTAGIAVVGVAGRYPQARNVQEFWQNLVAGKDCITEVPPDRWDHGQYPGTNGGPLGKTPCKWGGFLEGVDQFDAPFFNMSPREAAVTDPQERLFLETVWELLESAGYTRDTLQRDYQGKVGVYAGAMYQQYQLLRSDDPQEYLTSLSTHSSIANRVSYFFNLQGPSVALDTACSSAAVAVHWACESLHRGDCQLAIAGGVNLALHPKKYLGLSLANLSGSHPDSRSFGDGDGYIPAEGVGALLLKPLSKAIADGDRILAVIKSTAINHNGRGNGFTAPNPVAQAQLIEENFGKAGIAPRTVSYVEAAANGSPLGDSIELAGLTKAFRKSTPDEGFCAIGSVKSNMGHAESASGISQLTKVILQLHHRQLVPSIKASPLNPNVDFTHTPFYLQQRLEAWQRPVVQLNGRQQELPRRATVSAFGAGGTNAHLILEEYSPDAPAGVAHRDEGGPRVMVFSAQTEERLQTVAGQMVAFIHSGTPFSLTDLAFTLQVGREAMPHRLAVIAHNEQELLRGLQGYLDPSSRAGEGVPVPVFTGHPDEDRSGTATLLFGKTGEVLLNLALAEKNPEQLALYWSKGVQVPWEKLYAGGSARRIVLPTYPFDKRRCWMEPAGGPGGSRAEVGLPPVERTPEVTANRPEGVVSGLIAGLLGLEAKALDPGKPLAQYGFDSILFLQLTQQLHAHNPLVQLGHVRNCRTAGEIAQVLQELEEAPAPRVQPPPAAVGPATRLQFPELVLLNQGRSGRPVFWFHAAAGGVETYHLLAQKSGRPFYGIQARGYMTGRTPLEGIPAMAAYYAHIIQSVQPEGPYDLGGYSLGGVIAYEVTCQLQEMHQAVNSIVMLDSLYGEELKKETFNEKDGMLQAVNMALAAGIAQEPHKLAKTLIHRDQVDDKAEEGAFLQQLVRLAGERGLVKTEPQLRTFVTQSVKVQRAYQSDRYVVRPLPDPQAVACYYFRNRSGLFLGELAPYFLVDRDKTAFDHANYWGEWEKQFADIHIMDVDSDNHMMLLTDPKTYGTISAFCQTLYSGDVYPATFVEDFKAKMQKKQSKKSGAALTPLND